jgi:hypothetical protein
MERDFQVVKIFVFRIRIIIFDEVLGYGVKFNFNYFYETIQEMGDEKIDTFFMEEIIEKNRRYEKIRQNPELYKLRYKLKKYELSRKQINRDELPIETVIGTCYLIKNKTIFQISSYFSMENFDIRTSNMQKVFKSVTRVINMDLDDCGGIENADIFGGMDEMTTYNIERSIGFMKTLFNMGFELYGRY